MLGGDLRLERKVELREAAALAPLTQMIANGVCLHAETIAAPRRPLHYLAVNRRPERSALDPQTGAASDAARLQTQRSSSWTARTPFFVMPCSPTRSPAAPPGCC